jgi:hypothetical protein
MNRRARAVAEKPCPKPASPAQVKPEPATRSPLCARRLTAARRTELRPPAPLPLPVRCSWPSVKVCPRRRLTSERDRAGRVVRPRQPRRWKARRSAARSSSRPCVPARAPAQRLRTVRPASTHGSRAGIAACGPRAASARARAPRRAAFAPRGPASRAPQTAALSVPMEGSPAASELLPELRARHSKRLAERPAGTGPVLADQGGRDRAPASARPELGSRTPRSSRRTRCAPAARTVRRRRLPPDLRPEGSRTPRGWMSPRDTIP